MSENNEFMQKNETISEEIVSFESNSLFDPSLEFDSTFGFTPTSEFK